MTIRVNVICRNWQADRVLPRFARYLSDGLGWTLTPSPVAAAEVHYLMGYFESQMFQEWPANRVASLFTHREEEPPGNAKAALYDAIARRVGLRVAMCRLYAAPLEAIGPTVQPPLPVERDRFVIGSARPRRLRPVVGLSGYTYGNRRKGEDLAAAVIKACPDLDWTACGRGWPVPVTQRFTWKDMPRFYQGLDVLVCTSRVEGGPMPVLEALASGVPVVVPRGVGIIDELPDLPGIHRYRRGDIGALRAAVQAAAFPAARVDREALRAATAGHTIEAWCAGHAVGFAEWLEAAA
jgi:glycosyltransferase involved in cell wall biosynthesis